MDKKPVISIIIPVYNVEKYVSKAIESCIDQTFKDIEIICINDGSTDNSRNILKEYAKKDDRLKIIDKTNEGVSVARNAGIEASQGEYLLFLDADDWYNGNLALEKIYEKIQAEKFDVMYFNILSFYKTMIRKKNAIAPYQKSKNQYLVYSSDSIRCCCRKDFLKQHNIQFPISIKISEDHIFNIRMLYNNPKIALLDEYIYCYLAEREDSATKDRGSILNNQADSYKYITNTEFYNSIDDEKKLCITDIWAYYTFSVWSTLGELKHNKKTKALINEFMQNYKNFDKKQYTKMYGYKLLKYKEVYFFLLTLRNIYYKIRYRGVKKSA